MERTVRVVVIGDQKCGKTSLIQKWTEKQHKGIEPKPDSNGFQQYPPIDFQLQEFNFKIIMIDASEWCKSDLKEVKENVISGVEGIFLCYDISIRETFESIDKKWKIQLDKMKLLNKDNISIIVVGCKGDLNHAIDTSLITMTKPWIDDEVTVSISSSDQLQNALSIMASTILNNTKAQHSISSTSSTSKSPSKSPSKSSSSNANQSLLNNNSKKESFYATNQPSLSSRNVGPSPHDFKLKYFSKFTWCDFCDLFIWGVTSPQGFECVKCKYKSHKKCVQFVPHFCGVDT